MTRDDLMHALSRRFLGACAIACTLLTACSLPRTVTQRFWYAYATEGNQLYVLKRTERQGVEPPPIPERWERPFISQSYALETLDLRGLDGLRPVTSFELVPSEFRPGDMYSFIELDAGRAPKVWRWDALEQRLRAVAATACRGSVRFDKQDKRVLWLVCDKEEIGYRFDPPYLSACPIHVGPDVGIRRNVDKSGHEHPVSPEFHSVAGQPRTYVRVEAENSLYAIEGCANRTATRVGRFGPANASLDGSFNQEPHAPVRALLGITPDMTLYQAIREDGGFEVVLERAGQEARRFPVPAYAASEMRSDGRFPDALYLHRSGLVLWDRLQFRQGGPVSVVHSLDLATGTFRQASIPID